MPLRNKKITGKLYKYQNTTKKHNKILLKA